ncbi:patatin-like phospholipase family protein [Kribbella sp. NPDC056345]|uniref:patatin-like phospholipase family protein n=1 Tax=Kribbella sp. NPDC056345 TaxID=3345789 RepID=UPI0035DADB94
MLESKETPYAVTSLNALVLGGGGPVGASWMAALVHGLRAEGIPLAGCGTVLGTSAGAVVGAWLTMRPDAVLEVPDRMRKRAAWHAEATGIGQGRQELSRRLAEQRADDIEAARSLAEAAVAAMPPMQADQADALWRPALPDGKWPNPLGVVAVSAETGVARRWTGEDGIPLAVAVACSTAAPGAAPAVVVAGDVWVDGGVRTNTNADLLVEAASPGRVLIVAPPPSADLAREEAILVGAGHRVRVVVATRFYSRPTDMLDPLYIDPATAAGAEQAREIAAELAEWWDE